MTQDMLRGSALVSIFVAVALLVVLPSSCATCPPGSTSAQCVAQNVAVDCGKALAGPQGADIVKTVLQDLTEGAGATWTTDLLGLAERVGIAAVECAMSQVAGQFKGSLTPAAAKVAERVRVWKSLPRDTRGFPIVAKAGG